MPQYFIAQVPVPDVGQIGGFPAPPGTVLISLAPFQVPQVKQSSLVVPGQPPAQPGTVVAVFQLVEGEQSPFPIMAPNQPNAAPEQEL